VFSSETLYQKGLKRKSVVSDDSLGGGSHWTTWFKNDNEKHYFDSFRIQPPLELVEYLKPPIYYNTEEVQPRDQVFCGHLCLYVLKELSNRKRPARDNQYPKLI